MIASNNNHRLGASAALKQWLRILPALRPRVWLPGYTKPCRRQPYHTFTTFYRHARANVNVLARANFPLSLGHFSMLRSSHVWTLPLLV